MSLVTIHAVFRRGIVPPLGLQLLFDVLVECVIHHSASCMIALANECDTSIDCWVSKAGNAESNKARKGAYMLGRYAEGNEQAIDALVGQLGSEDLGVRLAALIALDQIAVKGSQGAVAKVDELRTREEGQSVWTRFSREALPIQARLRSRGGEAG